jgi:hypothetical protein
MGKRDEWPDRQALACSSPARAVAALDAWVLAAGKARGVELPRGGDREIYL